MHRIMKTNNYCVNLPKTSRIWANSNVNALHSSMDGYSGLLIWCVKPIDIVNLSLASEAHQVSTSCEHSKMFITFQLILLSSCQTKKKKLNNLQSNSPHRSTNKRKYTWESYSNTKWSTKYSLIIDLEINRGVSEILNTIPEISNFLLLSFDFSATKQLTTIYNKKKKGKKKKRNLMYFRAYVTLYRWYSTIHMQHK